MNKKKNMLIFLIAVFLISQAYSEDIKVISASIYYDANCVTVKLVELKAIYGYVSAEEFPGNATLFLLADNGQELYKGRFGFIEPMLVVSPPRADVDPKANVSSGVIYANDTIKQIFLPYFEQASKIKIVFDSNKEFVFDIKERLCNKNSICEKEESAISCSDCKPNEKDDFCVFYSDGICDPDCLIGVDSDCLKTTPKKTPTIQETPAQSPKVRTDEHSYSSITIIYVFIAALVLIVVAVLYIKRKKGD
ncbi:MAG: hypothetical protein N3F05_02400 [Candidatus Diapherotrites archaeon]|nr:hypothetical protein [Candidatus Diapherotrites archaeon]